MKYAEFISRVQQEAGGADVDFIRRVINASLGIEKPMSAHYSEDDLWVILEALGGARREGRAPARPEYRFVTAPALEGWWFRSSSYVIRDDLWIEPAPGAELEEYPLKKEALTELVADLEELGRQYQPGGVGADGEPPPLGPRERDKLLAFYVKHGPLGLKFRGVFGYGVVIKEDGQVVEDQRVHVRTTPFGRHGEPKKDLLGHFGLYLKGKCYVSKPPETGHYIPCRGPDGRKRYLSLHLLYAGYREDCDSVLFAAWTFSCLAQQLASGVVPGFLLSLEEALANSRPAVGLEARQPARLSVRWEPTSLLDAAYLRLFSLGVGGMRICEDPKCGRLFTPQGKRRYCSDRCSERHRKERNRKRQPAI